MVGSAIIVVIAQGSKWLHFGAEAIDWIERFGFVRDNYGTGVDLLRRIATPKGADAVTGLALVSFFLTFFIYHYRKEQQTPLTAPILGSGARELEEKSGKDERPDSPLPPSDTKRLNESKDDASSPPLTPEPNLVFRKPRIIPTILREGRKFEAGVSGGNPTAILEIKNDADSPHPVSAAQVRATVTFEEIGGEHVCSIPDVAWEGEALNVVRFRLGDTNTLIVACEAEGKVIAVERHCEERRGRFYACEFLYQELTASDYRVEVQLFAERPHKMVGKRAFMLSTRPSFKVSEISPIENNSAAPSESRAKREYIIERLKELIREEGALPHGFLSMDDPRAFEYGAYQSRVGRFLTQHSDEEHLARFKKDGVVVLEEMLKELLDQ
jgi:hypothetical protein